MKLYKHQLDILKEDPKVAGLFLGTGSGKTRTALLLARGYTLVICPKTQKEDRNWQREIEKLELPHEVHLTVMSKEEFRRDAHALPGFNTIIVDEAHTCLGVTPNVRYVKKQPIPKTSQLFEELEKFIRRTKPDRVYLATATIMRSPMTVWGAAKILGKSWDFYEFRDVYYTRLPMPGREVWRPKTDSATKDRLAETVRNLGYVGRLEDFFDVPDQTFKTIYVELSLTQKQKIKELKLEYPEPIVRVGKIHQVENGALSATEFEKIEFFKNEKLDRILDLAEEFPQMIIFAKYKAQIAQIASTLEEKGKKVLILTGDTKDRGAVIKDANTSTECVFIAQAQISAGWELPGFPVMVFASRTYSFVDYVQALGRIQRANNIKKNLYINLVVKGGVDEAVDTCLTHKQDFDDRIYAKEYDKA